MITLEMHQGFLHKCSISCHSFIVYFFYTLYSISIHYIFKIVFCEN